MVLNIKELLESVWPGWEPVRMIGKGSFGTVYEIQKINGNMVDYAAIKIVSIPEEGSSIPMGKDRKTLYTYYESIADGMVQEYEIMSKLKQAGCKNVVACDSYIKVPNKNGIGLKLFIQMELLTDLNTYTRRNGFLRQNIIQLGIDICKALEACKKAHVIHRDIKPANLFVSADGVYKLGDFGVAKRLEETGYAGSKQGTILYMAPEVYANKPYDTRADILSLGLVMYQLLNNGELPFDTGIFSDQEQGEAFRKRMRGEKIPMPALGGEELGKIVCRACEYNYHDRYNTPEEMRRELEKLLNSKDNQIVLFPVDTEPEDNANIKICFMSDEGENLQEVFYQLGEKVIPPEMADRIERDGVSYRFEGWEPAVPEKAIASMVCKAIYKEETPLIVVPKKKSKYLVIVTVLFGILAGIIILNPFKLLQTSSESNIAEEMTDIAEMKQEEEKTTSKVEKKWSDWEDELPNFVNEDEYDIEEQTLFSSSQRETTSSTSESFMDGWKLYDTVETEGEYNEWSDWSTGVVEASVTREVETEIRYRYKEMETMVGTESEVPGWELYDVEYSSDGYSGWSDWTKDYIENSDGREVQRKTQYQYRTKQYTSSSSSQKDGWILYDTSETVGEYGGWSDWNDSAVSQTSNRQVETRQVLVSEGKTTYTYGAFFSSNSSKPYGWTHFCPTCGNIAYGGNWSYNTYTQDYRATVSGLGQSCGHRGGFPEQYKAADGRLYYYEEVNKTDPVYKTQYRYRTRNTSYVYYYYKWSNWSEYSDSAVSSSSDCEVKTRTLYRYRDLNRVANYHFQRWGDWSDWSTSEVLENENRKVETAVYYRYRDKGITKTYCFERWTDWTEYTKKSVVESEELKVRTKQQYRYKLK